MALTIKNAEVERLATEVARLTGGIDPQARAAAAGAAGHVRLLAARRSGG